MIVAVLGHTHLYFGLWSVIVAFPCHAHLHFGLWYLIVAFPGQVTCIFLDFFLEMDMLPLPTRLISFYSVVSYCLELPSLCVWGGGVRFCDLVFVYVFDLQSSRLGRGGWLVALLKFCLAAMCGMCICLPLLCVSSTCCF